MSAPVPEQRRTLVVLVLAQLLSGAGLAAGITVGALLAQQMLGSTSLAGLPSGLFTLGSAGAAVAVGRISHRSGRRPGLALGYGVGALGALGVVLAALWDHVPLLFAALLVYGSGSATNLQARYAGADLAAPEHRGRAVSTVLVATTLGAVVGPNLVTVTGDLAESWGIPALAGPFVLAGVAYAAAAIALAVLLRPDPLLLARSLAARTGASGSGTAADGAPGLSSRERRRAIGFAAVVMVVTQLVMVAVMTMTPVHMTGHGHSVGAAGFVIAVHVAGMFLPSPLSGWLVDRYGAETVAAAAGVTLLVSGVLTAAAPVESVPLLAVGLALLGLGWSFGLVSGTALLTAALPLTTRARTQGTVDLAIALAGALGGAASGLVVAGASFAALALAGGVLAVAVAGVTVVVLRRRARPAVAA
ncbi:MFS transporter [Cellulomonas sp. APG4]|uniref:MFS transporter n=1 Tax=Cellulomonas sp. APG4 TaxID=1538656 RepID=UPI00137AF6D2|nr:MFS transporter [Cellulomonas sp. APG4]